MKSRLILSGATLALAGACAVAQTNAKPSAYEGVSQPPVTDTIRATESTPAAPVTPPAAAQSQEAGPSLPAQAPAAVASPARTTTENPDYGILDTPAATAAGAPAQSPTLHSRTADPDADIVTGAATNNPNNQLLEGTPIHARLEQQISSSENGVGTLFTAQVINDVMQNGRVIIPTGSVVHGRVTHADYGRRISGGGSLRLLANEIVLPDGTRYSIHAVPSQTAKTSNTKVNGEGTVLSKGHPKRAAAEYGVGAGSGALLGAKLAGPTGAIVGAGIGLGVVTAHVLLKNNAAVLPAGSAITFGLTQPMLLTPVTSTARF